jgi:hypothetical protein
MAKVIECRDKAPWVWKRGEPFEAEMARTDRLFEELMAASNRVDLSGDIAGLVVKFGVADGYAVYRVAKDKPLTLEHIPYGDAYYIDWRMLKGFTKADIVEMAQSDREIRQTYDESGRRRRAG